jgi:hypothetical protein
MWPRNPQRVKFKEMEFSPPQNQGKAPILEFGLGEIKFVEFHTLSPRAHRPSPQPKPQAWISLCARLLRRCCFLFKPNSLTAFPLTRHA